MDTQSQRITYTLEYTKKYFDTNVKTNMYQPESYGDKMCLSPIWIQTAFLVLIVGSSKVRCRPLAVICFSFFFG